MVGHDLPVSIFLEWFDFLIIDHEDVTEPRISILNFPLNIIIFILLLQMCLYSGKNCTLSEYEERQTYE